jgi:hypothetical protein
MTMRPLILCSFALGLAGACAAQQWELGASGGFGYSLDKTVNRGSDTAEAGFKPGPAAGVFVVQNMYKHLSGEIRYTFQKDDLKVSSAGTEATFSGQSHALHYDLLYLTGGKDSRVRLFAAAGGGVKMKLSGRIFLHLEARDYLTPFPTKVIAPVPPSTVGGWVHDFVPLIGISIGF